MSENINVNIPLDIYESPEEIVIIIPLWWVKKDSLKIRLEKNNLFIKWERTQPKLKETLKPIIQDCYRWEFTKKIELPINIYYDKIHSILTEENILIITVPKIIIPDKIEIKIN
jgi:HSP20 family molecular chaperone IbpA